MNGNIFLRTSVIFLLCGIGLGLFMGAKENFTQVPTHAHINLVGGVWMFLAGLFYNAHPQLSRRAVMIHYGISVIGFLIFIPGIAGAQIHASWYVPAVAAGGLITAIGLIYFAVMVFLGTSKPKAI